MRLGTRRSALALAQAEAVAELLGGAELVPMTSRGDRDSDAGVEDKSRWVADLEAALLAGEIDLAVHSAKDVLCGAEALDALAPGGRVGTSSLRRAAQLRAAREDIAVVAVRGNVDTRLAKLGAGDVDALVLARAGLQRLRRESEIGALLDSRRFVPAPGQGIVALEGREDDERAADAAAVVSDPDTVACLLTERALAAALAADCDTPLGAHCVVGPGGELLLRAWVGLPDGSEWIADEQAGPRDDPEALADAVAERMRAVGVQELLARARA
jgi:hydroxymethylbilane synthase